MLCERPIRLSALRLACVVVFHALHCLTIYPQERQAFGYGSKKARLNGESFLSFDACRACLNRARQPVKVCDKGHVYCNVCIFFHPMDACYSVELFTQECVITLLLSQKKDIKRHQAMIEKMKADEEAERQVARAMARERVLQDFEKSQGIRASNVDRNTYQKAMDSIEATEETRGVKRKFEMESSEVERLMLDSEERALRQLEREQADNRKSKLPSFWLPSLTPDAGPSKLMQEPKLSTLCKAADPPHPMTLKSLAQVRFAAPSSKLDEESTPDLKDDESYLCWACKRQLTNISRSHVLKPCGHVLWYAAAERSWIKVKY